MSHPWYVDTNVLLRHLLGDHPQFSPLADEFWESVRENRISAVLTEGVLMETVYVLTKFYKVPRLKASEQLSHLLRYGGLVQEPASVFPSALVLFAAETMDFVDCLLVVRERAGKGKVFSFDRKVARG